MTTTATTLSRQIIRELDWEDWISSAVTIAETGASVAEIGVWTETAKGEEHQLGTNAGQLILDLNWEDWTAPNAVIAAPENGLSIAESGDVNQPEEENEVYEIKVYSAANTSELSYPAAA